MRNEKGTILILVLGTILVTVLLANVILVIVSNNFVFTHHQVNRIRAYYAAQAGINLALANLRLNVWGAGTYNLNDPEIPYPVAINITNTLQGTRVSATASYTP